MGLRHQTHNLTTFHEENVHTVPKSVGAESFCPSLHQSLWFCQSVVSFVSLDSEVIMIGILILQFLFKLGRVQLTCNV